MSEKTAANLWGGRFTGETDSGFAEFNRSFGFDRRLFPAIDIPKSGTRKEEKLFPPKQIEAIRKLRRTMIDLNPVEAMETLLAALKKHKTNEELLAKLG